jgi:L-ascorbate metabolism protein UlaG (beta-lactamase superfamily)
MRKFGMLKTIFLLLIIGVIAFCYYSFSYVKYYTGKVSDHFDGTRFFDPVAPYDKSFIDVIKWRMVKKPPVWPDKVENNQFDTPPQRIMGENLRVSYVGHVTFLIQTEGLNILTDPVWSERASPVTFAGPKRVQEAGIKFENLPPIDIVWISHNHYDHLDLATIDLLWEKHKPRIITPLGNDTIIKNHNPAIEVEAYDWGDQVIISKQVKFSLDPMQHWSARNLLDKNKALWAALTIETNNGNIYFIGDSGYGQGRYFQRAKEKFGKFRLALLPMGAYEPRWFMKYAHMDPEEMVKAHIDLGNPYTVPSHYDVFSLTDDPRGQALVDLEKAKQELAVGDKIKALEVGQFWNVPLQ